MAKILHTNTDKHNTQIIFCGYTFGIGFFSSFIMVNDTNDNALNIFIWFKYLLNGWLIAIKNNHVYVGLFSSFVQHNDELYFVVAIPNNGYAFNFIKMNNNNNHPISIDMEDVVTVNQESSVISLEMVFGIW